MRIAAVVLLISALCASAQELASKMDEYLNAYAKLRGFMGTALIAQGGKTILDKGYGFANLELNVPNTPANKFRIGSITKQFTAAAIMQLQEKDKLSVTDQACKYVDNCPDAWKPVTIQQLLSHTSGIPSYTDQFGFATPKGMRIPLSPMEVLMLTRDKPMASQPGEKWAYDNSGYIFLGVIIEKVAGQKYADYLQEHIFGPLGLKDTGYDDTRAILPGRAAGYEHAGKTYRNADYIDMSLPYAAGSLYSNTGDLYRWDRALYTEKVVSRKSYEAMTTPVKNNYGYGFSLGPVFGHKHVGHGGGINGFSTCIDRYPDDNAVVIVLSNVINANACRISNGLTEILFTGTADPPRDYNEVTIDPKLLERYVGKYSDGEITLTVTAAGGRLYIERTGNVKRPALPYSDHQFFMRVVDITFDFSQETPRASHVVMHGAGPKVIARRVE